MFPCPFQKHYMRDPMHGATRFAKTLSYCTSLIWVLLGNLCCGGRLRGNNLYRREKLRRVERPALDIFCYTFAAPLVGDSQLGAAITANGWAESFMHVVWRHDIVPRLLLSPGNLLPSTSHTPLYNLLLPVAFDSIKTSMIACLHKICE